MQIYSSCQNYRLLHNKVIRTEDKSPLIKMFMINWDILFTLFFFLVTNMYGCLFDNKIIIIIIIIKKTCFTIFHSKCKKNGAQVKL